MFITFEGIDASGKSSAIEGLKKHIEQKYNISNFIFTREPGGKNLKTAELIRELILDNKNEINPISEALLYLASRKIHIEQIIKPSLKKNNIVICDRYVDSSIAYQGNGRELGMEKIEKMNLMVIEDVIPKYTFYLKVDLNESIARMKKQNRKFDRLEQEDKAFFQRVIDAYDFLSIRDNKRYIVINANQTHEKVLKDIIEKFEEIMERR